MGKTKIEWVRNPDGTQGRTWNPTTGCSPTSEGCTHCYARRMSRRLAGRFGYLKAPHHFDITLHPDRLEVPLRRKKPATYFVVSMGDLFHKNVPTSFIMDVWAVMAHAKWHTFLVLTKRSEHMLRFATEAAKFYGAPLKNIIGMVTAENQEQADRRIVDLIQSPFALRGVSCEPLLEAIDLRQLGLRFFKTHRHYLDWVICGGETGPGARPMHPDWARGLRDQCQAAGVKYFFKQHGEWLHESQVQPEQREIWDATRWNLRKVKKWIDGSISVRIGKKTAGRLLDSREWNERPEAR